MTTIEVLQAAKTLVELGWTKGGHGFDRKGNVPCYCGLTAILIAVGNDWIHPSYSPAKWAMASVCRTRGVEWIDDGGAIAIYNDASSTTHEDVLSAFDEAIELAKAQ